MGKIRCCSFCGGFNFGKADAIYTAVLVDLDHLDSKNLSCSDRVPLALILRQESLRMIGHCLCWTQLPLNRLMESFILSLNEDVYSIPFYSLRGKFKRNLHPLMGPFHLSSEGLEGLASRWTCSIPIFGGAPKGSQTICTTKTKNTLLQPPQHIFH